MLKSILRTLGLKIENDPRGLFAENVVTSEQYYHDMNAPPSRRIIGNAKELGADPTPGGRKH
jgi:hypothetical protein